MAEKLKKGEKSKDWKSNCKKFPEYYKKFNPDWSKNECEAAAKSYCKSINWQCIEYYQKNFPELSPEEQEMKMAQAKKERKSNSKLNIEYYQKNFPELSPEEHEQMRLKYSRENNWQNVEYYKIRHPEWSEEQIKNEINRRTKIAMDKHPNVKGENNPRHHSKISKLEIKQNSPKCIEFYEKRYPELTHKEHLQMLSEHFKLVSDSILPEKHTTKIEYWLAKGYNEEEAKEKLSQRQRTFSLEYCIKKYGEEEGRIIFEDRQLRWKKSLMDNFFKYGDGRSTQSRFAKELISDICLNLNIDYPKKEKFISTKCKERTYAYDFCYGKKLIEFNGDYWHCNPNLYDDDFVNKTTKMTAKETWLKDENKAKCARDNGYDILTIWEEEYNYDYEATLNKCMKFLLS